MLSLRDLECLIALARQRHFAKAAQQCGMSQPAFSMRIRNLEDQLGMQIVKRGNRFQGMTAEGEAILVHARRILDEVKALEQDMKSARGEVTGSLVLGAIPTASAYAAHVAARMRAAHPGITVRIETDTSLAIQQGILEGALDAGLTYSGGVASDLLVAEALYDESYVLLVPCAIAPEATAPITWREAATLPLCLLEPGMQNRQIIDAVFDAVGARPNIIAETSELTAALVMAVTGLAATIVPKVLVDSLGALDGTAVLPLDDPPLAKSISLVTAQRGPRIPTVEALRRTIVPGVDDK